MWILAQAKNGDKLFWKYKFHAANGKPQHALKVPQIFFFFSLFPTCLQQITNNYESHSQINKGKTNLNISSMILSPFFLCNNKITIDFMLMHNIMN